MGQIVSLWWLLFMVFLSTGVSLSLLLREVIFLILRSFACYYCRRNSKISALVLFTVPLLPLAILLPLWLHMVVVGQAIRVVVEIDLVETKAIVEDNAKDQDKWLTINMIFSPTTTNSNIHTIEPHHLPDLLTVPSFRSNLTPRARYVVNLITWHFSIDSALIIIIYPMTYHSPLLPWVF